MNAESRLLKLLHDLTPDHLQQVRDLAAELLNEVQKLVHVDPKLL